MRVVGIITVYLVTMAGSMWFNGYALAVLWAWFIVPTFGCVSLTVPAAIGMAMTVSYLTHRITREDAEDKRALTEKLGWGIAAAIIKPSMALLFGFVVKSFM